MPDQLLGPFQAFLFDMDGTLLISRPAIERVWDLWSERWRLDPVEVSDFLHGRRACDAVDHFLPHLDQKQRLAEIDWVETREMADTEGVVEIPGAAGFLSGLQVGRWAIVTSAARRLALSRLMAAGLSIPDILISAEDVQSGKPDPAGYLLAASVLGRPIEQCLIFEDAPAGIQAGLAAGGSVIVIGNEPENRKLPICEVVKDFTTLTCQPSSDGSAVVRLTKRPFAP